ncbi:hypothetical protein DL89DRAFT_266877 [Linderina pennispora]|uniref:Uncharacterized protein n=1 Tax=Linderina pennispora TaxID=61395 RepID=A0A1Y1WC31_9FUNG|nr:uncharacterized protein DL89DRAFT_266877 [Linderina pennispora]ORX70714.1 hypothetical protein DL89DRAFT_266877 [Linderina pennispora]
MSTATVTVGGPSPTTYTTLAPITTTFTATGPTPTLPMPTGTVPEPTVIEGGTGTVSGVTIIGEIYNLWMYILCPSRNCTPDREWLTFIPSVVAGWVIGSIALLLGLGLLALTFMCGLLEFFFGFLAMVLVAICLFLRAALKHTSMDRFAMYKVSIWFNYFAAALLALLVVHLIFRLIVHLDNTLCGTIRSVVMFFYVCALALFALLVAAVVLMFDLHSSDKLSHGIHCLQAFVIIVLILSVILLATTGWATNSGREWPPHDAHSDRRAARHSEVLWYIFNIVPLLLIAIVLLALNAPKMFTFYYCEVTPCPARDPHLAYNAQMPVQPSPHAGQVHHHHHHHQGNMEDNVQKFYM